ncbi:MAG: hypothetical protein M3N02_01105 [Pseudomonadota bacterium]|nr:hypothetical protein [Pseudomonadota bacterium]
MLSIVRNSRAMEALVVSKPQALLGSIATVVMIVAAALFFGFFATGAS